VTVYQQFWLTVAVTGVLWYLLWLLIHTVKLSTLRIRIERLEHERATLEDEWNALESAISAAQASVTEVWNAGIGAGRGTDNTDRGDSVDSWGSGRDQAASAGDTGNDYRDRGVSAVIAGETREFEVCQDTMNCDHEFHVAIGVVK
jgi:hypothetical protein